MTDPRPSENTDPIQLPGMRAAGFFDDLPKLTDGFFTQAELHDDESDILPEPDPNPLDALVEALATTNRHLEAIAHELRLKNRVVGL